ncbi:hypothetical protein RB653_008092 [Dictyostelium firmibasis]|uniref:FNIP repeat-containing protein n=1 Tax=Dictyostelium firmibasis TaxID=79012 RepID=A0AAN7YTR4_9MYCE
MNENQNENSKLFFSIWRNNYLKKKILRQLKVIKFHSNTLVITCNNNKLLSSKNEDFKNQKSIEILFRKNEKDYENMKKLLKQISNLPSHINELSIRNDNENFYKDNLLELESFFKDNLIPNSITSLKFDDSFPFKIEMLPNQLKILNWGRRNQYKIPIGLLPIGLEELHYHGNSRLKLGSLPPTLKRLYLGGGFKVNISDPPGLLPKGLEVLLVNKQFNHPLNGCLPESLTKLFFHDSGYFNQEFKIGDLPSSITELKLPECFNQPIGLNQLPSSLKSLKFTKSCETHTFKQLIEPGNLPNSLTYLRMNPGYDIALKVGSIPSSMKKLVFKNSFNQQLIDVDGSNRLIPDSVTTLKLDFLWNQKLSVGTFSNNLVKLYFVVGNINAYYNTGKTQIIEAGVLPNSLKTLRLSPKFIIKEGSIPFGLKSFHCFSTEQLKYLPTSVEKLKFVEFFNDIVLQHQLPPNITSLSFGGRFEKPLIITDDDAPCKRLKKVEFCGSFSNDLFLPSTVETLMFGCIGEISPLDSMIGSSLLLERQKEYIQALNPFNSRILFRKQIIVLPKNLKSLYLGVHFNKVLQKNHLPQSLTLLELGGKYTQNINSQSLPNSIKFLIVRGSPIFEKNFPSQPNQEICVVNQQQKGSELLIFTHSTNYQFLEKNSKTLLKHPNYLDIIKFFSENNLKTCEVYENSIYPYHIFPIVDKKLFKKISNKLISKI